MEPVSFVAEAPAGVVSYIISQASQSWVDLAVQAASSDCNSTHNTGNCSTNVTKGYAFGNFTKSCSSVSKAIVKTSAGNSSRVQSYMSKVCSQDVLKGKPEELCSDFSQYLVKEMSKYPPERVNSSMNLTSVCTDFFNNGYIVRWALSEQAKAEVEAKAAVAQQHHEILQNATMEADKKWEAARQAVVEAKKKADDKKWEAAEQAAGEAKKKAEESEKAFELQKHLKAQADAAEKEVHAAKAKAAKVEITNEGKRNITAKSFLSVARLTSS
jgi:hypothetical protein